MSENRGAETFKSVMKDGIVGLAFLAFALYSLLLLSWAIYLIFTSKDLQGAAKSLAGMGYAVGLPVCGAAALGIVCLFEKMAPTPSDGKGKLELKAFGLAFSGPAGPVALWVVCYLSIVASIWIIGGA